MSVPFATCGTICEKLRVGERDPAAVQAMFDRIARRYDLLNIVLSGAIDARWRRAAARATHLSVGGSALDVACGTGALTHELAKLAGDSGRVVGVDFSEEMLAIARRRHPRLEFQHGDALALDFRDASFDATTMAFGLRNLADPLRGLREMRRVLRPGGLAVVLEFLRPPSTPAGRLYRVYLQSVLPRVGGVISGDRDAYRYLSRTISAYHGPEDMVALAGEAGWKQVQLRSLTFRTVAVLSGAA